MWATAAALFAAGSPARSGAQTTTSAPAAASAVVFDAGLQSGWIDFGWSNKPVVAGQPVEVDMGDFGGWITAKPETPNSSLPRPTVTASKAARRSPQT